MRRISSWVASRDLLGRVGQLQVVELGRLREPVEVVGVAEDRRAALGLVAADPLEDAGPVVQPVAEHVDLGVLPGDELAVLPNQLGLIHVGEKYARWTKGFRPDAANGDARTEEGETMMIAAVRKLTYSNVIATIWRSSSPSAAPPSPPACRRTASAPSSSRRVR